MCPEPDFGWEFHRLMEYYRASPEAAARLLTLILDRLSAGEENPRTGGRSGEKGGVPP